VVVGPIGYETASRATPDGDTFFHGAGEMTMLPYLKKSAAKFDALRDFSPVALAVSTWGAFLASPKLPVRSLAEFIAYAKANPGKIRYATNGVGGAQHLAVELLQMKTGIQILHIPYKGTAQVATDTLSGHVEMASMGLSSAVANRSRLNVLAQTGPTRIASLPDVPTTAELGLPDVRIDIWFGLMAPANTPVHMVDRVARALDVTLKDRAVADKFFAMGCEITYLPPKAFVEYIAREKRKWAELFPVWNLPMED